MSSESAPTEDKGETCSYVARKDDPSNWHGDEPDDWQLDEDVWECPHEARDDGELCVFHTPPDELPDDVDEGEEFVRVVNGKSAEADGDRAERLKQFVGAEFGKFVFEGEEILNAGERDYYSIEIANSSFLDEVSIENCIIKREFHVVGSLFSGADVSFSDSVFALITFSAMT